MTLSLAQLKIIELLISLEQVVYNSPARAGARSCLRAATPTSASHCGSGGSCSGLCVIPPGLHCPLCSKFMASDEIEKHLLKCFGKTRLTYNSTFSNVPTVVLKHQSNKGQDPLTSRQIFHLGPEKQNSVRCRKSSNTRLCTLKWTSWFTFSFTAKF